METYKYCQSCGMPHAKDSTKLGTNSDGSLNTEYCINCYKNGEFTQPTITMDEMIAQVNNKMRETKVPSFLSKFYTRKIPKLIRWQQN